MKTRCLFGMNWWIGIVIGLFSIFFASESLAEENTWYFHYLKTDGAWKTGLSVTNLEDKNVGLNISSYDEYGDFLEKVSDVENFKVGETRGINGRTIPSQAKTLKIEKDGNIKGICLLETGEGRKSKAIPLIKEGSKQLDFPTLASDDIYHAEEPTSTETYPTIFNEDKDVWGWFSETYIVLHWNPYNFFTFRVYRQTNANIQWKLVSRELLKKPEYFDSDLDKFTEVSFKVEAVTEKGAILKSYTPVLFHFDRKNGGNHE